MPFGITEITNVTIQNITSIINLTTGDPIEFYIRANTTIYGGWFWFIMLWVLGFILYIKAQNKDNQPLINAMNVAAILTIISFFLRAITLVIDGVPRGLLTDYQMWMFPLVAIILAAVVRYMSD